MTASSSPDPRVPEYGSQVGSWIVRERVGSGGHGVVFRAVHADRPNVGSYALKLALEPGDERFEREVWLLSRLHHPSVPRFEGSGFWTSAHGDTYPYVVMQWVEGVSLYAWAAEHGLTLRQAIGQLAQVARALEATHRHGVHRDVKGGNIRVSTEGQAVLLDFGSCWYRGATPLTEGSLPPNTGPYRSPQQLMFKFALRLGATGYYKAPPEDDVYALGITAYRLLAGAYPRPWDSDEEEDAAEAVRLVAPRGLNEACPELSALILRLLAEDPLARGSAKQVAAELEDLLEDTNPLLDRPWVACSPTRQPTEKARRPMPRWHMLRGRVSCFAAAGTLSVLVLLVVLVTRNTGRHGAASTEPESKPLEAEKPSVDASGMGDKALASPAPSRSPPVARRGVARDMPDGPLRGQKRPPCTPQDTFVEINGGCWFPVGGKKPPCEADWYEHSGRCYAPFILPERPPTSEDPE
jgi:serine/threonine protein kinase